MTATPTRDGAQRLPGRDVDRVAELLETDFGRREGATAALPHHYLLDALDRGDHQRFVVWPPHDPAGVCYFGPTGFAVPAGLVTAGAALAEPTDHSGWRVLVGDAAIGAAVLDHAPRAVFRRRHHAREQRFMVCLQAAPVSSPPGMRPGTAGDVERLTELACRLHVEDRMGPPIGRSGRASVRARMADSVARGGTWVVERGGRVVAKVDLSLHSRRRGAQIAGVYVDAAARGEGLGAEAVGALTAQLLSEGLPGVTLHVRADNRPAIAAYRRAGFTDEGPWILALR